jgi:undecaprenyl-diphosphatase
VPGADWSSFPSDTATLYFALAYGLWRQSRIAGIAAFGFAAAAGCFARIALGIHYPADSTAGALIGVACVAISCRVAAPGLAAVAGWFETDARSLLYSLMFLLTCEMAYSFDDVLQFMHGLRTALQSFGFDVGLIQVFGIGLGVVAVLMTIIAGIMWGVQRVRAARYGRRSR